MASAKPIRFQYEPETTIREVEQMRAVEELAYRRILDLIILYRNRLIDDDTELGRMTKTGDAWPQIKARLVKDHGALYALDGFIRNVRYDEIWASVERSIHQKRAAGRASAARRQANKDAALPQPPSPTDTAPRQPLPDPPTTAVAPPCPEPPATEVEASPPDAPATEPAPMPGNRADDGSSERAGTTIPQDWRPSPEAVAFAVDRGRTAPQIEHLARTFAQRHDQRGDTSKDWNAGFKVWVLRDLASNPPLDARQPVGA